MTVILLLYSLVHSYEYNSRQFVFCIIWVDLGRFKWSKYTGCYSWYQSFGFPKNLSSRVIFRLSQENQFKILSLRFQQQLIPSLRVYIPFWINPLLDSLGIGIPLKSSLILSWFVPLSFINSGRYWGRLAIDRDF